MKETPHLSLSAKAALIGGPDSLHSDALSPLRGILHAWSVPAGRPAPLPTVPQILQTPEYARGRKIQKQRGGVCVYAMEAGLKIRTTSVPYAMHFAELNGLRSILGLLTGQGHSLYRQKRSRNRDSWRMLSTINVARGGRKLYQGLHNKLNDWRAPQIQRFNAAQGAPLFFDTKINSSLPLGNPGWPSHGQGATTWSLYPVHAKQHHGFEHAPQQLCGLQMAGNNCTPL